MSTIAEPTATAPATAAQREGHYESLYSGLDGIDAQLSAENREQLQAFTATEEDPQEATARMVNMAYLREKNPQIDADALADNWESAKVAYSKQILGVEKPSVSDKELYAGIAGKIQQQKDERGVLAEGMGKLFDSFRAGATSERQAFTATMAVMRQKPGYDPKRLDVYMHLAQTQWQAWESTGQHFPAAVDAVGAYFKAFTENEVNEAGQVAARETALRALRAVPPDQQDAILGLAMRQKGATEDAGGMEKITGRLEQGVGEFGGSAVTALRDLVVGSQPGGLITVAGDQELRKTERKLDGALNGSLDPYHGNNWLSEGVLGAAEGLPRMLAMFHPAGVVANVSAFAEEARGHFEDAGVDPLKARALGVAASIPLTALQLVSSKTVVGEGATGALEAWMLRNITGKTGAALAKGYAKNLLAQGAENTALLTGVTMGQQLTEPAIQSLGNLLDGTIPGVKWTGPHGELARVASATPETLASLVPLIALGTGAATLRTRGAALEARVVQNPEALRAVGLKPEAVDQVMAASTPDDAVNVLQAHFEDRAPDAAAVERLNGETEPAPEGVTLAPEGGYNVVNMDGEPIGQTESVEMAVHLSTADRARMRKIESGQLEDAQGGPELLEWIRGRLPRPDTARAGGSALGGELAAIWENLKKENKNGAIHTRASEAFFAKKGKDVDLDRLNQEANAAGFDFATPADLLAAVDNSQRGNLTFAWPKETAQMGIAANGRIGQILSEGIATVRQAAREVAELPQFKGFKEVLNRWVGDTQLGLMHTAADIRQVIASIPDLPTRKAIGRWLDAGGDTSTLEHHLRETTKEHAKKEYDAALKLTPDQIKVAEGIKAWFRQRFDRAVAAGVLEESRFREGYLTHLIERPFVQGGPGSKFNADLNKNFKYSKERTFPNLFELEKADFAVKTTDVAEIMARYDAALNKAILSRQLVKDLLEAKNEAGEALAVPLKGAIREADGDSKVNFINNPRQTTVDKAQAEIDGLRRQLEGLHDTLANSDSVVEKFDAAEQIKELREEIEALESEKSPEDALVYKAIDHPALRNWWWIGNDQATGKETFMEGDIGLHPEIRRHLENALSRSGLRQWYDEGGNVLSSVPKAVVKALDVSNGFLKANLLGGLSLFHAVHEYKRALGNRVAVNPLKLPEIDPENSRVKLQVRTGLMLTNAHEVSNLFEEGLGGRGSLVDKIPGIGRLSKAVSEYSFSKLIPALKSEVWNHVYDRNLKTFAEAIAKGDATKDQVAYLTSHQINARFGHQNYADMGRNPTFQHILQITTLAPDFWESNVRNYGQDIQGLLGAKVGREPIVAFGLTAAVLWITSRVLNKALDDDYHFEQPFAVVSDGRTYTMRNEVEDLWRMWHNSRQYIMGRISPSSTAGLEWLTAKNWRGEKIDSFEVFKNWVSKVFPMSLRFLPAIKEVTDKLETGGGRTVTVWQQFLGSLGLQVSRHSPLAEAYQLANDWRKANGDKEDRGTYPVSKYQQLRYALEDKDEARAIQEIVNLRKEGEPLFKLTRGFKSSTFNPWTGSAAKDAEFKGSLSPEDRSKVEKAEAHRAAVFDLYLKIIQKLPD